MSTSIEGIRTAAASLERPRPLPVSVRAAGREVEVAGREATPPALTTDVFQEASFDQSGLQRLTAELTRHVPDLAGPESLQREISGVEQGRVKTTDGGPPGFFPGESVALRDPRSLDALRARIAVGEYASELRQLALTAGDPTFEWIAAQFADRILPHAEAAPTLLEELSSVQRGGTFAYRHVRTYTDHRGQMHEWMYDRLSALQVSSDNFGNCPQYVRVLSKLVEKLPERRAQRAAGTRASSDALSVAASLEREDPTGLSSAKSLANFLLRGDAASAVLGIARDERAAFLGGGKAFVPRLFEESMVEPMAHLEGAARVAGEAVRYAGAETPLGQALAKVETSLTEFATSFQSLLNELALREDAYRRKGSVIKREHNAHEASPLDNDPRWDHNPKLYLKNPNLSLRDPGFGPAAALQHELSRELSPALAELSAALAKVPRTEPKSIASELAALPSAGGDVARADRAQLRLGQLISETDAFLADDELPSEVRAMLRAAAQVAPGAGTAFATMRGVDGAALSKLEAGTLELDTALEIVRAFKDPQGAQHAFLHFLEKSVPPADALDLTDPADPSRLWARGEG